MATTQLCPPASVLNFLQTNTGPNYPTRVLEFVNRYKGKTAPLKSPKGATWKIGNLDDTIYSRKKNEVNGWGKFYLPDIVNMQVLGVVEGTSCPCDQLVLMTCEDEKLYAYDGEELHEVALSLEKLCVTGMEYPASKSYYRGQAFKHMSEKDWNKVREGPVGKRLDDAHRKLVTAEKSKFLDALK
ncbi:uncharacterized protein ABDE67_015688 isoform 2-T2 [Symphorus nematophorus]